MTRDELISNLARLETLSLFASETGGQTKTINTLIEAAQELIDQDRSPAVALETSAKRNRIARTMAAVLGRALSDAELVKIDEVMKQNDELMIPAGLLRDLVWAIRPYYPAFGGSKDAFNKAFDVRQAGENVLARHESVPRKTSATATETKTLRSLEHEGCKSPRNDNRGDRTQRVCAEREAANSQRQPRPSRRRWRLLEGERNDAHEDHD